MIGGRFAPLTIMNNEHTDLDSIIPTAVIETAGEILGKHRQKKKPWVTAEIPDLCDRRRELKKTDLNLKDLRNTSSGMLYHKQSGKQVPLRRSADV